MRKLKIKERIHAEGAMVILFTAVLAVVLIAVLNIFSPHQTFWHFLAYFLIFAYNFWTVCFFRIPIYRKTTLLENAVLSPADGKVVANEIVKENEYFNGECRQISIFMSIYNVHVNWFPMDGEVTYYKYHPGKFLVAFNPKSSTDNEHNTTVVKDKKGREVLFRQIAGFLARRIVCELEAGDEALAGEEFGMIRFGSRLDVFLPVDAEVKVKIGDKTRGKVTVLGVLK